MQAHSLRSPGRRGIVAAILMGAAIAVASATVAAAAATNNKVVPVGIDVVVTGVSGEHLRNVLAHLDIWQQRKSTDLKAGHVAKLHRLAPKQIATALQPFGYYQPTITASLRRDGETWRASYTIDIGTPVPITSLDIQLLGAGASDAKLGQLTTSPELRVGSPLDHRQYEELKARLLDTAIAEGYLDADYEAHRMTIDLDDYQAAIILHLDTGNLYHVGDVDFDQSGPIHLSAELLRRFVTFPANTPLTSELTLNLQTALTNSGYFRSVEIVPQKDKASNDIVPLQVKLATDSRSKYRFGAGFGTDTGARGSVTHERLVNERGHQLSLKAEIAQRNSAADMRYSIPLQDPVNSHLEFSSGISEMQTDSRESRNLHVGVARTRLRGAWRETLGVTAEYEDYEVGDIDDTSKLLFPNANWTRTVSNHPLFPTHGWHLNLNLLGAAESLGSDVSFAQGRIDGKWLTTYAERNRLIARAALGATGTSSFTELPPSKRFFAGGDNSVRGYDFEALGTTDADGDVVGGRYLAVGSLEYERLLTASWGAAVFYDVGNAFNSMNESFGRAVGIGARWRTPIGLVRLDVARPLTDSDSAYRIHLVIGPEL